MKLQTQIITSILACTIAWGVSANGDQSSSQFSPPYSNPHYSCRCIPIFDDPLYRDIDCAESFALHKKFCELKTYIRSLQQHVSLLTEIYSGQTTAVTQWFEQQAASTSRLIAHKAKTLAASPSKKLNPKEREELLTITQLFEGSVSINNAKLMKSVMHYQRTHIGEELSLLLNNFCWLKKTAQGLVDRDDTLAEDLKIYLKQFPWGAIGDSMQSQTLKEALRVVHETGSTEMLLYCWDVLAQFVNNPVESSEFDILFGYDIEYVAPKGSSKLEKKLTCAFLCIKELSSLVYTMYGFLFHTCASTIVLPNDRKLLYAAIPGITRESAIIDLFKIYMAMSTLPVEQTLNALMDLIKKFGETLTTLQNQAQTDFVSWLKTNWVLMPLAVGVVIVRIVQYFLSLTPETSIINNINATKDIRYTLEGAAIDGEHKKIS